ncbi:MAG: hypothetical protein AAB891_01550, partial [Patescibacteria group bacterium]
AQGVRRAEFPLRTHGSERSLEDSLTALPARNVPRQNAFVGLAFRHGRAPRENYSFPDPFRRPPFIPARSAGSSGGSFK